MAFFARTTATEATWQRVMADYRAYLVGADGHFVSYRAFVCDNDSDATVWAKQLVDGDEVELWSGERFVTRPGVKSEPRRAISHEYIDGRMVPKK
jgi:hypothetical protein